MVFERRRPENKKRFARTAGAVAAVAVGTTLLVAPQASAADKPSVRELLQQCNTTSSFCAFHPQSFRTYTGPAHRVGEPTYNCDNTAGELSVGGQDTTGSSDNVGITITASAGFAKVFEVGLETSYNRTWERSHTDTVERKKHLNPWDKGWMERGTPKRQATGWYEIQFKKRYYGHFVWYVKNYTESGWDVGNPGGGYINMHSQPMTRQERNEHCHR
ncbi:hypothetical protein SLINC_4108 [Streptomyces lincolnensis]|uniref:Uncharacterized protein n=1 Tax=Streptomyces lincolnensis TaxID=1915 RepID=A0A1B1MD65_STRLN|nr:hypothetical protein [Streptomyces lincolnensis]ANS66332.1 hypothetical protein SLINC_4108 [Streptomyces lincolnensis]AXG55202.1 hypothetical protein SLCG_4047 [Streptomyces lincolnensis]MCD7440023.1 hypothetical protein [Streptomyces lincolnensis]QMV08276.1 hypothetical protein GJU35_23270 [Streptomyces lincolnensis]